MNENATTCNNKLRWIIGAAIVSVLAIVLVTPLIIWSNLSTIKGYYSVTDQGFLQNVSVIIIDNEKIRFFEIESYLKVYEGPIKISDELKCENIGFKWGGSHLGGNRSYQLKTELLAIVYDDGIDKVIAEKVFNPFKLYWMLFNCR